MSRWQKQLPALRDWNRVLLLPGGLRALKVIKFQCETDKDKKKARDVDKVALDGVKMKVSRKWLELPELRFTMCLRMSLVQE